ncbi:uncharacterized protein BX663DRAFT_499322 [Cokeromyces recurvatus]|uniref:uncharacterized protein n=1 Tax=Cokeromyces recurvatus TaxID=90255 RepID=UPI00221E55B4|nr:uncharacterized protein BX663DRAFT_499322 [Cokeromyces recurvatus]KAI7906226.1 hypothetical protein BX663DRAFT_499322 [Cokeromyces recurvatus]
MVVCKVCENQESKYKCPTCHIAYCSLTCYKKHKEIPCSIVESNDSQQFTRKEIKPISAPDEEDPSQLIKHLDSSSKPESELDSARDNDPIFDDFAKKLVDITYTEKLEKFMEKQRKKKKQNINNKNNPIPFYQIKTVTHFTNKML